MSIRMIVESTDVSTLDRTITKIADLGNPDRISVNPTTKNGSVVTHKRTLTWDEKLDEKVLAKFDVMTTPAIVNVKIIA